MTQKALPEQWSNIKFRTDITPHILQLNLSKDFNQKQFDDIIPQTFVHKLTHKIDESAKTNEKSFYNYLLKH